MPNTSLSADTSEAVKFVTAVQNISAQMNTTHHLNAVTGAAFEILSKEFNKQTGDYARTVPNLLHHVYEWEQVGIPGFELWANQLRGRGGRRTVTWEWRASKVTVPTMTRPDGTAKWKESPGFHPDRLRRIHVFVWKAPMMEYGVTVTISPKLSNVLVIPNPNLIGRGGKAGPSTVTFTPHPVTVNAGEQEGVDITGNFTTWFIGWWGGPSAQNVLDQQFSKARNQTFKRSFEKHIRSFGMGRTARSNKAFSFTPNGQSVREGKKIAMLIAGEMENNYIRMAAERRAGIISNGQI